MKKKYERNMRKILWLDVISVDNRKRKKIDHTYLDFITNPTSNPPRNPEPLNLSILPLSHNRKPSIYLSLEQSQLPSASRMRKSKSKAKQIRKARQGAEQEEITLLNEWVESQKPDSGANPLSLPPLPKDAPIGQLQDKTFSRYSGCTKFHQLPLSKKTKDGLRKEKYVQMTDIQRASLPHALCGRDILGAAKTGSGKTLAFVIPVSFLCFNLVGFVVLAVICTML